MLNCLASQLWVLVVSGVLLSSNAANAQQRMDALREAMVNTRVEAEGITNKAVLSAMRRVPRHEFVAASQRARAYDDVALPIGNQQTISPPFVVAYMTESLDPQPGDRVLEIGTDRKSVV